MASRKKTRPRRSTRSGSRGSSARKHPLQESLFTKRAPPAGARPAPTAEANTPAAPPVPSSRLRHTARAELQARYPVHVSWHVVDHIPNLRAPELMAAIRRAFIAGKDRFGFRLVHFNVQDNHVHLKGEADDKEALSRGMQGLAVRFAKAINKVSAARAECSTTATSAAS